MLTSTTLRIDSEVLEDISKVAAKFHLDRGTYLRQLVMQAYEEKKLELNIEDYKNGKITIGQLAEKTNKTIWEIMEILKQRKILSNISLEDAKEAMKNAEEL